MMLDLHNDLLTSALSGEDKDNKIASYIKGGNKVVLALWADDGESFGYNYLKEITDKYSNSDNIYISLENCGYITDKTLHGIAGLPLLCASLTWNTDNSLGGGAYGKNGLSAMGKKVVRAFVKNGIVIDTAHANLRTFYDIVSMSGVSVVNTHTLSYDVYPHRRNITSEQIGLIKERGGVVGITLVRAFVGAEVYGYRVIRHIDWIVQKHGIDCVSIGTDYYGSADIPKFVSDYDKLEDYLTRGLGKLGYTKEAINKILFGNADSFINRHTKT